jgi:pimeloyl-ACP methyl ester carboxylesterase
MTTEREGTDVGEVVSQDGTTIAYRRYGSGPAVILLHGSMETGLNHQALAMAVAGSFTVYVPDRRGRGLSGPYGDDYCIQREVEDMEALLTQTTATNVFGVSAGGLVALEAARMLPAVKKIALYEPALVLADTPIAFDWIDRFDRELAAGDVAAAMVTSMVGLKLAPPALNVIPRRIVVGLTNMLMKSEDKKARPDDVTMRKLAPSIRYEGVLLRERKGTIADYADVSAETLLIRAGKGLSWLWPTIDALEKTLQHTERVTYQALDHGGSGDVTKANPKGKPELVAQDLVRFFGEA